ncbi:hypothetical protein AQ621_15670 [Marinobacter sp. P4B1]|nr:hypothetical protein AQ621_15670 [Marinobacter sp. P4B1]
MICGGGDFFATEDTEKHGKIKFISHGRSRTHTDKNEKEKAILTSDQQKFDLWGWGQAFQKFRRPWMAGDKRHRGSAERL